MKQAYTDGLRDDHGSSRLRTLSHLNGWTRSGPRIASAGVGVRPTGSLDLRMREGAQL
jgi:hypothetical protein